VEVKMKASRMCYLSNEPPFYLVLHLQTFNMDETVTFLRDGYESDDDYQPINSNQVIQCFDEESGEQVQVLRQGSRPKFLDRSYVQFKTSKTRKDYELPIVTTSLRPDRKYRLRFKPTCISHWPVTVTLADVSNDTEPASNSSTALTGTIPWQGVEGNDMVVFETRASPPSTPKVTVALSASSTYSLSKPFTFTLRFKLDAPHPITVHADRQHVQLNDSDIRILDVTSRSEVGPDLIDDGNVDGGPEREEFRRIDGIYRENREVKFGAPGSLWEDTVLKVGEEYILTHLGDKWRWWSENTVDDIMEYLESESGVGLLGLPVSEGIEFASAGEVRFMVVE
jgi:hypothetical protein